MLFYLDNWLSVGPDSPQALGIPAHPGPYGYPPRPRPNARQTPSSGLNENYGRELLELHTLSVNGGYSQRDVTEVAKVFTGWTIEKPKKVAASNSIRACTSPDPKLCSAIASSPRAKAKALEVLHLLATEPADRALHFAETRANASSPTIRRRRLVDRMAKTF